jgi:hypothetical protein
MNLYQYNAICNIFLVHELLIVHHTCTTVHNNHILRCMCFINTIMIVWLHYMLFVMWNTVKPNPQLAWYPFVHIYWQLLLLLSTAAHYMHLQKNSFSIHTGKVTKHPVSKKVTDITGNVPEHEPVLVSVMGSILLVHTLLTIHHTCTTKYCHCVLRCIFVTDILFMVYFYSMLFVSWTILKSTPPHIIMAICSHTLTIPHLHITCTCIENGGVLRTGKLVSPCQCQNSQYDGKCACYMVSYPSHLQHNFGAWIVHCLPHIHENSILQSSSQMYLLIYHDDSMGTVHACLCYV